ncbi:hypothetical protein NHF46_09895 [Arthrobacter alpinus]|nr:hypothetical protein [Arthrobacter alpinus]
MSFELTFTWIAFGILAVAVAVRAIIVQTTKSQQHQVFLFWQRVGLPMGSQRVNDSLRRRLHRSTNATLLGGVAGGMLAVGIYVFTHTSGLPFNFMWLVALPAVIIGATVLDVALTVRDSLFGRQPDAPRMARLEAVGLRNYMSPKRLYAAPLLLVLAAALAVTGLVLGATGAIDSGAFLRGPALPFLLAAAVVLGLCVVMARKILEQPQPAADTLELAWDDAIRADVLRKLGVLASVMAWLAVSAAGLGILDGLGATAAANMGTALGQMLSTWGYFAVILTYTHGSSLSWFRQRLWPNFTLVPAGPAPDTGGQEQGHTGTQGQGQGQS